MPEPLLSLAAVDAAYRRRPILEQISLAVPAGRITALLGPNGAGKSTVLKAIFGLARVTSGQILWSGEPITGGTPAEHLRRGIVYLPQGGQVFGPLTVTEHLAVTAAAMGSRRPADEDLAAAAERLAAAGLPPGRRAADLSGGQKQQVAVAMALLWRPRLLLIDEPSIGLAPALAHLVNGRIVDEAAAHAVREDPQRRRQFTFGLAPEPPQAD